MTAAKGKISLSEFLEDLDERAVSANAADLQRLTGRLEHLRVNLDSEPEMAAQTEKLIATLPAELANAALTDRKSAVRHAQTLVSNLKERWIAAEAPPMVDQIDTHLKAIDADLTALTRPDADALRRTAARIDGLAEPGRKLVGIEKRFRPWALLGSVLFLVGVALLFQPGLLMRLPTTANFWLILGCLCFLPALAVTYAWRVLPRSRADAEIDMLNRSHFLPYGGLYFPADDQPAGIILVDHTPAEPPDPTRLKDPRKTKEHEGHGL